MRSRLLDEIRGFFQQRAVLEVETPVCCSAAVTDPALASMATRFTGPGAPAGRTLYLHTSPEFAMKRLLAAGSGPIFQVCKVFRDGEAGRLHNPEFTLLEWYRPGFDYHRLMDEVAALVRAVLPAVPGERRLSYREVFLHYLAMDPFRMSAGALRQVAMDRGICGAETLELSSADGWLDLLLTHCIEPVLGDGLSFIYDYPASQASLARVRPGDRPVAERFELYLDGVELANGFQELTDAAEQRRRFQHELAVRRRAGMPLPPLDERFLAGLDEGMPECSGVALGVDRLLMRMAGVSHIDEILPFSFERA